MIISIFICIIFIIIAILTLRIFSGIFMKVRNRRFDDNNLNQHSNQLNDNNDMENHGRAQSGNIFNNLTMSPLNSSNREPRMNNSIPLSRPNNQINLIRDQLTSSKPSTSIMVTSNDNSVATSISQTPSGLHLHLHHHLHHHNNATTYLQSYNPQNLHQNSEL